MNTIKKFLLASAIAFLGLLMITIGFIGVNESYSMADAKDALLGWRSEIRYGYLDKEHMPVGFGSVPVQNLGASVESTAYGSSGNGNALAVYITPDVGPILSVLAFVVMVISLLIFCIGTIMTAILQRFDFGGAEKQGQIEQT